MCINLISCYKRDWLLLYLVAKPYHTYNWNIHYNHHRSRNLSQLFHALKADIKSLTLRGTMILLGKRHILGWCYHLYLWLKMSKTMIKYTSQGCKTKKTFVQMLCHEITNIISFARKYILNEMPFSRASPYYLFMVQESI